MARASAVSRRGERCEECWPLVGARRGRIWLARKLRRSVGQPHRVEFDGPEVLAREEARGDVVGFLHTHPQFEAAPSARDVATMQAWVGAFGKPLLCLIHGTDGLAGYVFVDPRSPGVPLAEVASFARGAMVAVER